MPFDCTPETDTRAAQIALFQERRDRAAEIWQQCPKDKWHMGDYGTECGSVACALGWLATREIDDWQWDNNWPGRTPGRFNPDHDAAEYFGLANNEASALFDDRLAMQAIYGMPICLITPTDVARTLLAMPITLPGE